MNQTINLTNLSMYGQQYGQPVQQLTFETVLDSFSSTFVFRMELLALAFFAVEIFLQWYTKQLEIEYRQLKKEDSEYTRPVRDRYLIFVADVFFIPAVAFIIIFIGYESGWYI